MGFRPPFLHRATSAKRPLGLFFQGRGGRWLAQALAQRTEGYWRIRNRLRLSRFYARRMWHSWRQSASESRVSISLGVAIARSVLGTAVVTAVGVAALKLLDTIAFPSSAAAGATPTAGIDATVALFATIAQVEGAFLGLYFAALSVIASTTYREVPASIRAVVVEERAGTVYLRAVSVAGAGALYCLGLLALGIAPGILNAAAIGGMAALSVPAFVVLGLRAFTFFDPSSIARTLTARIRDASRDAAYHALRGDSAAFEKHALTLARAAASTLRELVSVTKAGSHSEVGLAAIASDGLITLREYARAKGEIAPASEWFERMPMHPSWLTADSTRLDLALRSGAWMDPSMEPNLHWLEESLVDTVAAAIRALLECNALREILQVLQVATAVIDSLASDFQLEAAFRVRDTLTAELESVTVQSARVSQQVEEANNEAARRREKLHRLAVVEAVAAMPCTIIAAFGRGARAIDKGDVDGLVDQAIARETQLPIGRAVPQRVREVIASLRKVIAFERDVEGETITPEWFVGHHLARAFSEDLSSQFDSLLRLGERWYAPQAEALKKAFPEAAATLVQRGREAKTKLEYHGQAAELAIQRLREGRRDFDSRPWPELNRAEVMRRLDVYDARLLEVLGEAALELDAAGHDPSMPDVFGYACTTLAEGFFSALVDGHRDLAKSIFPRYFALALRAHERVRKEQAGRSDDASILFAADIVVELTELSAYGYLDSALFTGDVWTVVETTWERYLSSLKDPRNVIRLIVAEESYREARRGFSARELLRTGWSQRHQHLLQSHGLRSSGMMSWGDDREVTQVPIDLPAAAFASGSSFLDDPRYLFLAQYLLKRPEAADIEWPRGCKEFENRLSRARERRKATHPSDVGDWEGE